MKLNLVSDRYPDVLCGLDVIFYRNVSIYFEPETQRSIFNKLAGLLREKGWLFVSATETLSHNHGVLPLVELDGVFCYQKNVELTIAHRTKQTSLARESSPAAATIKTVRPAAITPLHGPLDIGRPPLATKAGKQQEINRYTIRRGRSALLLKMHWSWPETRTMRINRCIDGLWAGPVLHQRVYAEGGNTHHHGTTRRGRTGLPGHRNRPVEHGRASPPADCQAAKRKRSGCQRFKEALYIQSSCWLGFQPRGNFLRGEVKMPSRGMGLPLIC